MEHFLSENDAIAHISQYLSQLNLRQMSTQDKI
jgi:hypothetical protein